MIASSKCANNNKLCKSICCPTSKSCPPWELKGPLNPGVVSRHKDMRKSCHLWLQGRVLGAGTPRGRAVLLASSLSLESAPLSFTGADPLSPFCLFSNFVVNWQHGVLRLFHPCWVDVQWSELVSSTYLQDHHPSAGNQSKREILLPLIKAHNSTTPGFARLDVPVTLFKGNIWSKCHNILEAGLANLVVAIK